MLRIAQSVVAEGATDELLAHTSMHDLKVTTPPQSPWAKTDYVHVALMSNLRTVRIRHEPLVGLADDVKRPIEEAVPLFWRFMIEKYGVRPIRDTARTSGPASQ